MLMDPRRGDVFEMVVNGVLRHRRDPILRIFADAVGMTDVEVQPDPRRVEAIDELQILAELFDQQFRLRFDEQPDAQTSSATSRQGISSS